MRGRWWFAAIQPRRDVGSRVVWALPKGLIDAGERVTEAAVREVREETGIEARVVSKLGDVRYVYTWQGERVFKVVSFFLVRPVRGRIGALPPGMDVEVADARWFQLEEAATRLSYHGEREMAAKALASLDEG
jgi:8-oxo-dGTP diphosphatase